MNVSNNVTALEFSVIYFVFSFVYLGFYRILRWTFGSFHLIHGTRSKDVCQFVFGSSGPRDVFSFKTRGLILVS